MAETHRERKAELVSVIVANEDNEYTPEQLAEKPIGELKKIAKLAGHRQVSPKETVDSVVRSFALQNGLATPEGGDDDLPEPLPTPSIMANYGEK